MTIPRNDGEEREDRLDTAAPIADDPALDPATIEVDGEERLDPDADDDLIDGAEADRRAAGAE